MASTVEPLRVRVMRLAELGEADITLWSALHAASPLRSPLMSWEFAQLADAAYGDVAVARADMKVDGGDASFILPFHRRANRFARPLGATFSDVHGPLASPDFLNSAADVLRAANISGYRFTSLEDPANLFAASAAEPSLSIVLDGSPDDYIAARRRENAKRVKNYQRLENKLEREQGAIDLIAPDASAENLALLLDWKRDQLKRTGLFDVFGVPANIRFMELAREASGNLSGLLLTLTLNGRPIAGQFGVRLGDRYHPWIAAFDPSLSAFSPGITIFAHIIRAMPALGITHIDLGQGHAHYKKVYASHTRRIGVGVAFGGGLAATTERAADAVGRSLEAIPMRSVSSAVARLRRRADLIAAAETRFSHRAAAMADALVKRSFAARSVVEEEAPHAA